MSFSETKIRAAQLLLRSDLLGLDRTQKSMLLNLFFQTWDSRRTVARRKIWRLVQGRVDIGLRWGEEQSWRRSKRELIEDRGDPHKRTPRDLASNLSSPIVVLRSSKHSTVLFQYSTRTPAARKMDRWVLRWNCFTSQDPSQIPRLDDFHSSGHRESVKQASIMLSEAWVVVAHEWRYRRLARHGSSPGWHSTQIFFGVWRIDGRVLFLCSLSSLNCFANKQGSARWS